MASVIMVMWPELDDVVEELGGQMIGANGVAIFPGAQKQAIRSRLSQMGSSSALTILEITGIGSQKVGMASQHEDAREVLKGAFPGAGNFF